MLETFGDMVNEVLQYGFNDGPQVNRKRIEGWVNEAQRQVAREVEAAEFQKTDTFTLVQGQWKYPLPEDFLRVQDIFYPELAMRLRPMDLQQFDGAAPQKIEGSAEAYTLYGNELWIYPSPNNGVDTLELRYIAKPPLLVAEGDIPAIDRDYLHVLVDYATERAFKAEDDIEAAAAHRTRYREDLDAYATDKQFRVVDRPMVLDGTWGGGAGYGGWMP